jgi:hypothetical protein
VAPETSDTAVAFYFAWTPSAGAADIRLPQPRRISLEYSLRIDPAHLDAVDVAFRIDGAPESARLAMKLHPEYNAGYWNSIDSMRVDGTSADARAVDGRPVGGVAESAR